MVRFLKARSHLAAHDGPRSGSRAALWAGTLLISAATSAQAAERSIERGLFGRTDGRDIDIYMLIIPHGIEARVMRCRASLVSLQSPDREWRPGNIIFGF